MMTNETQQKTTRDEKMRITGITINKGLDIKGTEIKNGVEYEVWFGAGVSIDKAVQLLDQYANGPIVIEYQIHSGGYAEKDIKMFNKRIDTLVNKSINLEIVKPTENKVVQGYVWETYFVTGLNYKKGEVK